MMSVELVLAPGVTDSASALSYPSTNELVNSLVKALVYTHSGGEDPEHFSGYGRYGALQVDVDFRKRMHMFTLFHCGPGSLPYQDQVWGCKCRSKAFVGTLIYWFSLADFNVDEFKLVSASHCKFPKLIVNFIDGEEAQGSRRYPTIPPQLDFPTYIEAFSHQTTETVRVSSVSPGT